MTTITLPPLPYASNALEPHIGKQTVEIHHGKHQKAYVDKTNELIKGTDLEGKSLEEIIKASAKDSSKAVLFNNAAQAWNHIVYWDNMKANGGGKPSGDVLAKIEADFGSYDKFVEEFKANGLTQFGSGWVWLVLDNGKLKITKTANADNPVAHGQVAVLGVDVWEHAYYLDYQNRRVDYLSTFLDHLVNWDYAAKAIKG
ncbi:MAG: superoxide dismutase [Alphaproteobacteria bacterium]|nr:superoxide dismutase [Alphaproteobacteria bacterium]